MRENNDITRPIEKKLRIAAVKRIQDRQKFRKCV